MNILEYEAKSILATYAIPIPKGTVVAKNNSLPDAPMVLKSQVHSGGRGKAGGIKVIMRSEAVAEATKSIFALPIKDELPRSILCEEVLNIAHEYYLSLVINRGTASIELVAHREGGVEVESETEFGRWKVEDGEWRSEAERIGQLLADYYDLQSQAFVLQDLVENLLKCFVKSDATLLEINPLVLTADDTLIAGDCKMILDDAAAFRHPEWNFEQAATSANFVTLDQNGTVATIANGAGLAMATVDAVQGAGFVPANFLDIGGAATVDSIVSSFRKLTEFPRLSAIIINIFGGIVRCDDVAKAIIEARAQVTDLPSLYIRLSGTNSEAAAELLAHEGLTLYPTLTDCIKVLPHA